MKQLFEPNVKVYHGIRTKRPQLNGTSFLMAREQQVVVNGEHLIKSMWTQGYHKSLSWVPCSSYSSVLATFLTMPCTTV